MKPLTDTGAAHILVQLTHGALHQYGRGDAFKAMQQWLDALIVQTQTSMTDCHKDKLADTQVRLHQLIALRSALQSDAAGTGFIFN